MALFPSLSLSETLYLPGSSRHVGSNPAHQWYTKTWDRSFWNMNFRFDREFVSASCFWLQEDVTLLGCPAGNVPNIGHAHIRHAPLRTRHQSVYRNSLPTQIQGMATFWFLQYSVSSQIMVTTRRLRYIVFCLWFVPLMFVFGWFVAKKDDGLRQENCSFTFYNRFPFRITIFLIFMLPLISTLIIYGCILARLLKAKVEFETYCTDKRVEIDKTKAPWVGQTGDFLICFFFRATRSLSTRSTNVYSKLKLVWTTLLIVSTFSLSWGLCVLYFVMVCADGCMLIYRKNIGLYLSLFLNSTVNILVRTQLHLLWT